MNLKKFLKTLYGKYKTYGLQTLPYRQYIFEVKFKNIEDIAKCKSPYLLSTSYNTFLEDLQYKGHLIVDSKEYFSHNIEYTKLIKTNVFYAYAWDCIFDLKPLYLTLDELTKRQKEYIKYAKYLTPRKLKELITHSKNYYV